MMANITARKTALSSAFQRTFRGHSSAPAGATLAFHALAPDDTTFEMLGVKTGTGLLTATHTSELYALDHENIYRKFAANEPVWAGGRVVTNHFTYSEDFSNSDWATFGAATKVGATIIGGVSCMEIQFPGGGNQQLRQGGFGSDNKPMRVTFHLRAKSGSAVIKLGANNNTQEITLDETWRTYSHYADSGMNWGYCGLHINDAETSADFYVAWGQVEILYGQTNTDPGEYVQTTTAAASKIFGNANGNTVDVSNVVTFAAGAALAEAPYLQYYPPATNSCLSSRDLTNAAWLGDGSGLTKTFDQAGLTGEPNTATLMSWTSQSRRAVQELTGVSVAGQVDSVAFWIKKSATDISRVKLGLGQNTNNNATYEIGFNVQTGYWWEYSVSGALTINQVSEVVDVGNWWKVIMSGEAVATGNNLVIRFQGNLFAANDDMSTTATGSGAYTVGNLECYIDKTIAEVRDLGPIFTEGASVSADAIDYYWDTANLPEYTGLAAYQEMVAETTSAAGAAGFWYNTGSTSYFMGLDNGTLRTRYFDSLSAAKTRITTYGANKTLVRSAVVAHADVGNLVHNVDGSYGAEATNFASSFVGTQPRLSRSTSKAIYPFKARNIRVYDIPDYQTGKDTIDGLMGA